MTKTEREKAVAICEGCQTVCAVWMTADGDAVPVSSMISCECDGATLRVLDAETLE